MIVEVDRYLRRTGMTGTHLFKLALGAGGTYRVMQRGGELKPATIAKVRAFMAAHPDGVAKRVCGAGAVKRRRDAKEQAVGA